MADFSNTSSAIRTLWQFLDLNDEQLERADLVAMNIAVARGIPTLADLDVDHYVGTVDKWTAQFAKWLPTAEPRFHRTPHNWKNDLHFFHVGMLQGFLGHYVGIGYVEEQKNAKEVYYRNPSDLFLNGLIDTLRGTCGSMATLHVAISRRMGWPVSLACAKTHCLSRYDDGKVYHNIETSRTDPGVFASDPDEKYVERFKLPQRAIACGSDLRKLTAREMLGLFVAHRGRHYSDSDRFDLADPEYSLSRFLFPRYRNAYIRGMMPMLHTGAKLFERGEVGHPVALFDEMSPIFSPRIDGGFAPPIRAERVNKPPVPDIYFSSLCCGSNVFAPSLKRKDTNHGT